MQAEGLTQCLRLVSWGGRGPPGRAGLCAAEAGRQARPVSPPGAPQDEYEELDSVHKEERVQLEELRQRHDVLVEEFAQIRQEREVSSRKRMEADQEMVRMVRAATLIQAVWKGYLVRSMLRSKRKKRAKSRGKEGKEGKGAKAKGKKAKGKA